MKNEDDLIGRKVKGFRFDNTCFLLEMNKYIGEIGVIKEISSVYSKIEFEDGYWAGYPTELIEQHLVEDEIPTLSDGVMMLVSHNKIKWNKHLVFGKNENVYCAWYDDNKTIVSSFKYAKPIPQNTEEKLTAILGSSDKVKEIMELFNDKKE